MKSLFGGSKSEQRQESASPATVQPEVRPQVRQDMKAATTTSARSHRTAIPAFPPPPTSMEYMELAANLVGLARNRQQGGPVHVPVTITKTKMVTGEGDNAQAIAVEKPEEKICTSHPTLLRSEGEELFMMHGFENIAAYTEPRSDGTMCLVVEARLVHHELAQMIFTLQEHLARFWKDEGTIELRLEFTRDGKPASWKENFTGWALSGSPTRRDRPTLN